MGQAITPVLDTDIEKVKEQLAMAAALRKQGMEGTGGAGYHGGRVFAVGNQLGNIAQMIGGQLLGDRAREQQAGIERRQRQERQDWLGQMPQYTEQMDIQQPTPEQEMGPTQAPMVTEEVSRDPRQVARDMRNWSAHALAVPGLEGIGQMGIQQSILAPEKQADRAAAAEAAQLQFLGKAQEARALQRERLDAANQRAEESNALRLTLAGMHRSQAGANADLDRQIKEARLEAMHNTAANGTSAQQKAAAAAKAKQQTLDEAMANIDILLGEGSAAETGGVLPKSTGSGAGKMLDAGAGFFGFGTSGARNAAKIGPLANPILMQVPRFEGPQSDADTRVYKEAAGQLSDSSLPVSVRMSAAKTVKDIMLRRKGQFGVQGIDDSAGSAPAISDQELLDKYNRPRK